MSPTTPRRHGRRDLTDAFLQELPWEKTRSAKRRKRKKNEHGVTFAVTTEGEVAAIAEATNGRTNLTTKEYNLAVPMPPVPQGESGLKLGFSSADAR